MKTAKKIERTDDNPFALNEDEMEKLVEASEQIEDAKKFAGELLGDVTVEATIGLAERVFCLRPEFREEAIEKMRRAKEIAMAVHDHPRPSARVTFWWFDRIFADGTTIERLDRIEEELED